jgi:hypothetical protein
MKDVKLLIESCSKFERQVHLKLDERCIERGGCSTNHKGVLAEFLQTTIPNGKEGIFLCHACHNGKCSNPKHLYWGTPSENIEDSIANGTHSKKKGYTKPPMPLDTREKISSTLKGRPSNNKMGINGGSWSKGKTFKRKFKQIWINNGVKQTRIKFDSSIPKGYTLGRL